MFRGSITVQLARALIGSLGPIMLGKLGSLPGRIAATSLATRSGVSERGRR
jgi:hypothetical protein